MEIEIKKKEDGEVVFESEGIEYKFEYEELDKLIEQVYANDDTVTINTNEELAEYKELIRNIVSESRKQDYREAVQKAKEAAEKLEEVESEIGK